MGLNKSLWVFLNCLILCILCFEVVCDESENSEVSVKFLKAPRIFSKRNSATFVFEGLIGSSAKICSNCSFNCELDGTNSSKCQHGNASFVDLRDGYHSFLVCANASQGLGCARHNWTVDTIPPTASIIASTSFTSSLNVSVYISFSEPCTGRGGFGCLSVNACNLLVYGDGQVVPNTLSVLQPNLKYSLLVSLSPEVHYGRAILVIDKDFCTDFAGNGITRTENSSFVVHFDRRDGYVSMRIHVPEQLLELNGETRSVQAANNYKNLKVYLYFTEPVLNTSSEILSSLSISEGSLRSIAGNSLSNRRFGYMIKNISSTAILTLNLNSNSIITRQGTPVSPVAPATFLYDSKRPSVRLSTTSKTRTRERSIAVSIRFTKPVFEFNSTHLSIARGYLLSFQEISRSLYAVIIQANDDTMEISVQENVTKDVAGNKNLASNVLRVRHYSTPIVSNVVGRFTTASFIATTMAAGLLTASTASLLSIDAFPRSTPSLTSDPTRNLFRIACYIQVFALSRWLPVMLPVEYYEFTRELQWSIPYLHLPWETERLQPVMYSPNTSTSSYISELGFSALATKASVVYGSPLTSNEYESFFERQNSVPEAEYISDPQSSNGWKEFKRSMFWLAVMGGGLMIVHGVLVLVLKFKKNAAKEKKYGALIFPRFEIFLLILAVPCICLASASVIKGRTTLGMVTGVLLLGFTSSVELLLFLFLSFGITLGNLLQYKEIHQEGWKYHWYQELIRVTLGPGKRGQWSWKNIPNSKYLTIFGPLFEDLRGPPKYMLSQIAGGNPLTRSDRIIASDDENEDSEAPFIQKLFGILRIYYTLLESIRRFLLGVLAGAFLSKSTHKGPVIALLCLTFFQLFFLVLKKPFIKKRVQLVEIISIACETSVFATCLVLLEKGFSTQDESRIGIFMLILFILGYVSLLTNECYALYLQIRNMDTEKNSFLMGLKATSIGLLLFFVPQKLIKTPEKWVSSNSNGDTGSGDVSGSANRSRSSSRSDRPWMRQLREMARAGFKEGGAGENDPSTSYSRRSGFWGGKRSGSSSMTSFMDNKSRPRALNKDLETIFASK